MTLTLTLRSAPAARVWAPALVPQRLQGLSPPEVAALTVRCGRETVAVGELFDVSGTADEQVVLRGDLRRVDGIGMGMDSGAVLVPSFDDPWIVEGQGSAGIEATAQLAAMGLGPPDVIVACCGGGGLSAGLALAGRTPASSTALTAGTPSRSGSAT